MNRLQYLDFIINTVGYEEDDLLNMSTQEFESVLDLAISVAAESHWEDSEEEGPYGGAFRNEQDYWNYRGVNVNDYL